MKAPFAFMKPAAATNMKSLWLFSSNGQANYPTNYMPVMGGSWGHTAELTFALIVPTSGTLTNLRIYCPDGIPGSGNGHTITVRKSTNGGVTFSDTALTCTVELANTASDLTHQVSVNAGDYLVMTIVLAGANGFGFQGGLTFTSTNPGESVLMFGNGIFAYFGGDTDYVPLAPPIWGVAATPAGLSSLRMPSSFTLKNLYVSAGNAAGVGQSVTFTLCYNGTTASSVTAAISGVSQTANSDLTHTLALTNADRAVMQVVMSAGSATILGVKASVVLVAGTNGQFIIPNYAGLSAPDTGVTSWLDLGVFNNWDTTRTAVDQQYIPAAFTARAIYVGSYQDGAPGSGKKYNLGLWNGSAETLNVDLANTATEASATTDMSVAIGDSLSIQSVPTGTPTSIRPVVSILATIP